MGKTCFLSTVIVALVHCLTACIAMGVVTNLSTDQSALLALKAHITSDPLNTLTNNWSTTTTASAVCHWIGVICTTRHHRVAALVLSHMGLTGTIPPHIGNLSFLVQLDIYNNSFHGYLPQEMARLRRLKLIDVGDNNFGGPIPPWLGEISQLKILQFGNNSFTGSVPQEVGGLHNLRSLDMDSNKLTGFIPITIFNISTLQFIDFSNNSLSGSLPVDICYRLSKLESLYLYLNEFDGLIPSRWYKCSQLQRLSLSYNKFRGPLPSELGNLTMLRTLYLGGNNLEGEIPHEIGNLNRLEFLALEEAGLSGRIPASIFNISSLKLLGLVKNKFVGSLPRDMCLHLLALEVLVLEGNELGGSISSHIGNCTSLNRIMISDNKLTGVIPDEIGELPKIEFLSLNSNHFSGSIPTTLFNSSTIQIISIVNSRLTGNLPSGQYLSLPNLKRLHLGNNTLTGPIPSIITNASQLTTLDLANNKLSGSIPNSIAGLTLIKYLNLGSNLFSYESSSLELEFITSLTNCIYLTELLIFDNPLNGTLPISIGNLSGSLESFSVGNSRIMGNMPHEIGNLSNLISLVLSGNSLTGFIPESLKRLQKLQLLGLETNILQGSIPNDLCLLQMLGTLRLGENELFGQVPACLGNISSLRNLYLQSNRLNFTLPVSLWSLKDLLTLNLSSNAFTGNLPPEIGNLKVAITIDLSMNQLFGQIPTTMEGLHNLLYLSLAQNRFEGHIPESFGSLLSLQYINLSYNNLSGAIPKSLEALKYLEYFNVSFNKLSGEIPTGGPFANFTSESFMDNEALCGAPQFHVPACYNDSNHHSKTRKILLLTCIPLSVVSILLALMIAFALIIRRRKRLKPPTLSDEFLPKTFERVTYQELLRATEGFSESNLLGIGSFGSVYKGILTNGTILAIKVFNLQVESAFKSFDTECEILRNIRHRNLTKVISSCSSPDFKALILEYMPNGNLEKWLYSHNYFLDISKKLEILIDVACALEYLHHGYSTPVLHLDLKPSNVLLDEDMVARVSDFGIAKFLGDDENAAHTKTIATLGYMAPEYGSEGLVSTKCDVYSFGIMLMETFTRTSPTDEKFIGDFSLRRWVEESLPNEIIQVADTNLLRPGEEDYSVKVQCVSSIMELALHCSTVSPNKRINMKDVLASLKKIRLAFLKNCGEI
ncbi:probable LRR receptor-like serine/threonine-protein kinase At3g47570 isoform X1 [Actinidia eriantha]|uniref:probable LRR receptor-like serine/threonine-protein kinase At3g47570 isoform X1 n=1 Tax=Actinidia eriantha TaxID=165200 RepID=UPI0025867DFD|nr:probable LRR receptor-like serine/threonine-protein kinase At3g47570 isoform X1 [Actinidia eriantha]